MRFLLVPASQVQGDVHRRLSLAPEQQHYLTHVLRLSEGDRVDVVVVVEATERARLVARLERGGRRRGPNRRACTSPLELIVESEQPLPPPPQPALTLAVGLLKGPKLVESVVRSATELGLAGVALVRTERSVPEIEPAGLSVDRLRRLEQITWSACQQSGNAHPPALSWHASLDALLATRPPGGELVMALASGGDPLAALVPSPGHDQTLLVGPEGDFSPAEVDRARAAGARLLTIASPVMRVESACAVLPALLLARMGRL